MIKHHAKSETLAAYAAGTLDAGRAMVVTEHLHRCAHCRSAVADFEAVGGAMLEAAEPVPMSPAAREAVLARLEAARVAAPVRKTLKDYELGPWRWIGPGLHLRAVHVPVEKDGARVFMLRGAPGTRLPQHKHDGTELTCILSGAFQHEGGYYSAGDCDDADEADLHSPVIAPGEDCICVVAMQGNIVFQSRLGRLIQPFVRL